MKYLEVLKDLARSLHSANNRPSQDEVNRVVSKLIKGLFTVQAHLEHIQAVHEADHSGEMWYAEAMQEALNVVFAELDPRHEENETYKTLLDLAQRFDDSEAPKIITLASGRGLAIGPVLRIVAEAYKAQLDEKIGP